MVSILGLDFGHEMVIGVLVCVVSGESVMAQDYGVDHNCLSLAILQVINPASDITERVLNFVSIPCWEQVVISSEVGMKGAEKCFNFPSASNVAFSICNLELVI